MSRRIANSVCRGVVSSEAEFACSPEGRSTTLERGGVAVRYRGSRRGGLERDGNRSAGSRGVSNGPYCGGGLHIEPFLVFSFPRKETVGFHGPDRSTRVLRFEGDLVS